MAKTYSLKSYSQKDYLHPTTRQFVDKFISAGIRIPPDLANIDQFVKQLSLIIDPSLFVCWPMRSTQNTGSGTTLFSLGGLGNFNGVLTNGPTWTSDGITSNSQSNHSIISNMANFKGWTPQFYFYASWFYNVTSYTTGVDPLIGGNVGGNSSHFMLGKRGGSTATGRRNNGVSALNSAGLANGWHDASYICSSTRSRLVVDLLSEVSDTYGVEQLFDTNSFTMASSPSSGTGFSTQSFAFFSIADINHIALRNILKRTINSGLALP